MILRKKDYHYARQVVLLWLELYPEENRTVLANRLVQNTQAPVLIIQALVLEIGGHDAELQKSFEFVSNWYKDTVE